MALEIPQTQPDQVFRLPDGLRAKVWLSNHHGWYSWDAWDSGVETIVAVENYYPHNTPLVLNSDRLGPRQLLAQVIYPGQQGQITQISTRPRSDGWGIPGMAVDNLP